jgi:hypothetical protein
LGRQFGANGSEGQQFKRAIKWDPEAKDLYDNLPDKKKLAFRKMWFVIKQMQFSRQTRVRKSNMSKTTSELGEFMTPLAIANALGGAQFKICREQAFDYCMAITKMAIQQPEKFRKFITQKPFLRGNLYLFNKTFLTTTTTDEWEMISEGYAEVNEWKDIRTKPGLRGNLRFKVLNFRTCDSNRVDDV